MEQIKLKDFQGELLGNIKGDVSFDKVTLGIYATDASIYQINPVALVAPLNEEDVITAVKTAAKYNISILPRGGATSLGGQCVGSSMIIDFTKYMGRLLEINIEEKWARVQPGIVLDLLNAEIAKHGLHFGPDPATSSRATLGGMIGNNSSGTRSTVFGKTLDNILETRVLCADGTFLDLKELSPEEYDSQSDPAGANERRAEILSGFKKIIQANHDQIIKKFPKIMRRVQGYNLDSFVNKDRWNLSDIIVGSEGTLGTVLEARLNLVQLPKHKIMCTVHFAKLSKAIRAVAPILKHSPSAVEIMDLDVIIRARNNLSCAPLCGFIDGDPEAILIVEFIGETLDEVKQKADGLIKDLKAQKIGYYNPVIEDPQEQADVWNLRKSGLGLILGIKGDRKPLPFIEDCSLPIDVLPEYIDKILDFCGKRDVPVAMYAHAGVGTIHVRPVLNLKDQADINNLKAISEFAFRLVIGYGGSWSGEHGDGRVRSPYLERYFGKQIYNALREVKKLFDPAGLMNPGVIIDPDPIDKNLRFGTGYKTPAEPTFFHFREAGGFAAAVEMCTGVGTCRQKLGDLMCPSYRGTLDEEHSTRGRANALRLAMTGQLGQEAFTSKRLFKVLDLCLACKGCKSECPSNVDMTRLKSEFLQKYHDKNGISLRDRIIANSHITAKLFSGPLSGFFNFMQSSWIFRKILSLAAGFDSRRIAPTYARLPFPEWFRKRTAPEIKTGRKVVLFDDVYMNYHQANIGISAVELLESCGYEVILANAGTSQRPRISHGFLRQAKADGEKTLRNLDKYISQGLKIVACEPSSCSALTDDLPDLMDDEKLGMRIKENVMMIDTFLGGEIREGKLKCGFSSPYEKIMIHGNCHQKSLFGTNSMKELFDKVPGISVILLDSGCCGMAGSFGYEKEHYELSLKIGGDRLFPAIKKRREGTAVIASGFSCRKQISDGTGVKALHWVEAIRGDQNK